MFFASQNMKCAFGFQLYIITKIWVLDENTCVMKMHVITYKVLNF